MRITAIKFLEDKCFTQNWAGLNNGKKINVIIGKNNSGKSHFLNFIREYCKKSPQKITSFQHALEVVFDIETLHKIFPSHRYIQGGRGSLWSYGAHLVNKTIRLVFRHGKYQVVMPENDLNWNAEIIKYITQIIEQSISTSKVEAPYTGKKFRQLYADRDIIPEKYSESEELDSNGSGATNIVQRLLYSSGNKWDRSIIQDKILSALNQIFGPEGNFKEIAMKHHETDTEGREAGSWEIYLREDHKGLIPLSNSGSGLKTIILMLLNLFAIPKIENLSIQNYVFAFEELENNLHPSLLRRLFQFLEDIASDENGPIIFLTSHSNIALDFFGNSKHAQIIRVTHDGISANTETVSSHIQKITALSELGARPSDILQANGIIWVEGPSDRIYINRWIELLGESRYIEGRDYQCLMYGGSTLANHQAIPPEQAHEDLINILRINSNFVVICDSDRKNASDELKQRVARIREEIKRLHDRADIWVLRTKEIENYIPGSVIASALNIENLDSPEAFENFFPKIRAKTPSFIEEKLNRKSIDKTKFAVQCSPFMTVENMSGRFEWKRDMQMVIDKIQLWNR